MRAVSQVADARVPALCLDRSSQAETGKVGDLSSTLPAWLFFQGFRQEMFPLVEDLQREGGRRRKVGEII